MKARIKTKWLKALRSGKYKQGRGKLIQKVGTGCEYCCLGVLCDLYAREKYKRPMRTTDRIANTETQLLPHVVQKWAGFKGARGRNPFVTSPLGSKLPLSLLNDGASDLPVHSFTDIATRIEQSL